MCVCGRARVCVRSCIHVRMTVCGYACVSICDVQHACACMCMIARMLACVHVFVSGCVFFELNNYVDTRMQVCVHSCMIGFMLACMLVGVCIILDYKRH